MTVILSVNSRQYPARTMTVTPVIPANTSYLKLTATRENWPAGEVVKFEAFYPDGESMGATFGFSGGTTFNRDGSPRTESTFTMSAPPGQFLPVGEYTVVIEIKKALTTAVTVERE